MYHTLYLCNNKNTEEDGFKSSLLFLFAIFLNDNCDCRETDLWKFVNEFDSFCRRSLLKVTKQSQLKVLLKEIKDKSIILRVHIYTFSTSYAFGNFSLLTTTFIMVQAIYGSWVESFRFCLCVFMCEDWVHALIHQKLASLWEVIKQKGFKAKAKGLVLAGLHRCQNIASDKLWDGSFISYISSD